MSNDSGNKLFDHLKRREDAKRPVARIILRPLNGWRYLGSGVWENENKVRIHVSGRLIRFANGDIKNLYQIPDAYELWGLMMRAGSNAKRAMMAIARNVAA